MIEAFGVHILQVPIHLQNECLASQGILSYLQRPFRVEIQHVFCRSLFLEGQMIIGQMADHQQEIYVISETGSCNSWEETVLSVLISSVLIIVSR